MQFITELRVDMRDICLIIVSLCVKLVQIKTALFHFEQEYFAHDLRRAYDFQGSAGEL